MTDDILARLRRLEDREAIRVLQATYCFLVDDGRFVELVEQHFTEDACCDFRDVTGAMVPMVSRGRGEILEFFTNVVGALLDDMSHTVHNERIRIDGRTADAECYFELTAVERLSGKALVGAGRYLDRYRRDGEAWRFAERKARMFHLTTLEDGWARRRLLPALTGAKE
ncbi:MAG: nuclear transport factor 2 family protein [Deltaproteobacteria bacterium]|nr:nuclear transport factor 2 family protein [Deltaproteobacteria bacterium]